MWGQFISFFNLSFLITFKINTIQLKSHFAVLYESCDCLVITFSHQYNSKKFYLQSVGSGIVNITRIKMYWQVKISSLISVGKREMQSYTPESPLLSHSNTPLWSFYLHNLFHSFVFFFFFSLEKLFDTFRVEKTGMFFNKDRLIKKNNSFYSIKLNVALLVSTLHILLL